MQNLYWEYIVSTQKQSFKIWKLDRTELADDIRLIIPVYIVMVNTEPKAAFDSPNTDILA